METNQLDLCTNCAKPLPCSGFFCGSCLTQFKCKSCGSILEKDHAGCINCGTPKNSKNNSNNGSNGLNTFRLHETGTDRTIEAKFSDNVGKDLTEMLRDTYALKLGTQRLEVVKQIETVKDGNLTEAEVASNEIKEKPIAEQVKSTGGTNTLPTLLAIAMKNLPGPETEWVIVYSFYASNYGKDIFSRQSIIDKYEESKRKNNDRMNALTSYIKQAVRAGYINPLADGFSLLDKGIEKAKEIIGRTTGSAARHKSNPNQKDESDDSKIVAKKASKSGKSLKRLVNIDFAPSGKESLDAFYKKISPSSDFNRNLLFVFYMQEILQIPAITLDHIYTCYDSLNLRISENLTQTVRNTKSRTGWIETEDTSNITVTVKGRNQIKSWSKKD